MPPAPCKVQSLASESGSLDDGLWGMDKVIGALGAQAKALPVAISGLLLGYIRVGPRRG